MATQPLTGGKHSGLAELGVRHIHCEERLQDVARIIVDLHEGTKDNLRWVGATRRRYEINQGLPACPSARMIMDRLNAITYGLPRKHTRSLGLGQDARHYRGRLTGSTSAAVKERRAEDIGETVQLFALTPHSATADKVFKITRRYQGDQLTDEIIQRMINLLVDLELAIIRNKRS